MTYQYQHPRPALTVDCVVFGWDEPQLSILLIQRKEPPHQGTWALPGGFVHEDEALDMAARRELQEETGLDQMYLEQLYTFGGPGRDPRGHIVTVAYYALVDRVHYHQLHPDTDAADARWFPLSALPELAFDHDKILKAGLERLRNKVRYRPIGFELLPREFSLAQLRRLYETILGTTFDRRNFRKKLLSMELLIELDKTESGKPHRGGLLYEFNRSKYAELERDGFQFRI